MDDSYLKEFEATVVSVHDDNLIVLDNTAFYPQGGGQPSDTGRLIRGDEAFPVVSVGKFSGSIRHEVSKPGLKEGDAVRGVIDWPRRYKLMRAHTASHIISSVFHEDFGCKITGNQLSKEKIRIDFDLEDFDRELLQSSIDKANSILAKDLPVTISYMERGEALNTPSMVKLAGALPPAVKELRIVSIGDADVQADGGTHVKNTSEVGAIALVKAENKGKSNRRVYVRLVD